MSDLSQARIHTHRDEEPWHTFETVDLGIWPRDTIAWNYLVAPSTGAQEFEMGVCRIDPGGTHVLHHHRERAELYYVIYGTASVSVGGETFEATPGSAFYIPPGVSHGFVNRSAEVFEIVYVYNAPATREGVDTFWDE